MKPNENKPEFEFPIVDTIDELVQAMSNNVQDRVRGNEKNTALQEITTYAIMNSYFVQEYQEYETDLPVSLQESLNAASVGLGKVNCLPYEIEKYGPRLLDTMQLVYNRSGPHLDIPLIIVPAMHTLNENANPGTVVPYLHHIIKQIITPLKQEESGAHELKKLTKQIKYEIEHKNNPALKLLRQFKQQ